MQENEVKLIIFDFDGTLADTFPLAVKMALEVNKKFKLVSESDIDIEKLRNLSSTDFLKSLGIPLYQVIYYLWKIRNMMSAEIESVPIFAGLKEVLTKLHDDGLKLGVVTLNTKKNVQLFFKSQGIDFFDAVENSPIVFNKARAIKRMAKKLEVSLENTVYVGDETRDIESARSAGVMSAAVTWGYQFRDLLIRYKPDRTLDEPNDILALASK